jgi:hypothetical protein
MSEGLLSDLLEEYTWLYRGVPVESGEVQEVATFGEVTPPRPDRTGDEWRQLHMAGETTTAYTSWTIDRSIAIDAASSMCDEEGLSAGVRVLRIRIDSLSDDRVFFGRDDEYEYLIEGRVQDVSFYDNPSTDEEDDD